MYKSHRIGSFLLAFLLVVISFIPFLPVVSADNGEICGYEVTHIGGLGTYQNSSVLNIIRNDNFFPLLRHAFYNDLALILVCSDDFLYGFYWTYDGRLATGVFLNPLGRYHASLLGVYSLSELTFEEDYNVTNLFFSKVVAEAQNDFKTIECYAVDWDVVLSSGWDDDITVFVKEEYNSTWSFDNYSGYSFRVYPTGYDFYSATDDSEVVWAPLSSDSGDGEDSGSDTDSTEPTSPNDPPSPSIPDNLYPGPRGAQTPVWVKKLDILTMPNFQVGSDPVTFEAQAYTNDGGTIYYKWRLSGQKWNDGGFIPGSETEYTPSSNGTKFQVPLTEEGLYSLTCIAYNVFNDEVSGIEFTSQITTCSITFTVTERESDPVPDTIKPPYEGWEDDMVNAQGLNKEIQDSTDNIDNVIEITDSIVTPNIDNINLDLGSLIDPAGFAAFGTILGLYWENNIVMLVITIAFVLAMIGFYLFGKR